MKISYYDLLNSDENECLDSQVFFSHTYLLRRQGSYQGYLHFPPLSLSRVLVFPFSSLDMAEHSFPWLPNVQRPSLCLCTDSLNQSLTSRTSVAISMLLMPDPHHQLGFLS